MFDQIQSEAFTRKSVQVSPDVSNNFPICNVDKIENEETATARFAIQAFGRNVSIKGGAFVFTAKSAKSSQKSYMMADTPA